MTFFAVELVILLFDCTDCGYFVPPWSEAMLSSSQYLINLFGNQILKTFP